MTLFARRAALCACALLLPALVLAQAAPATPATPAADGKVHALETGMRTWTGDFDAMAKRRVVRVLVPYSKTFYNVEKGRARGISAEIVEQLQKDVNAQLKTPKTLPIRFVALPVGRDELVRYLLEGRGDVVIADLTVTDERRRVADFSAPMFRGVREIPVTAPGEPPVPTVDDLAGREVFVRRDTSYWEHLAKLNERLAAEGKAPVRLREAPAELESEDILEMVDAGLVRATVVDGYKAAMWKPVFTKMTLNAQAGVNEGGEIAWMIRPGSPQLKAVLDAFVARHAQGTTFGNSLVNRYAKNPKFAKNAIADDERRRYGQVLDLFRKYSDKYDVDYLLMMAQGFQESALDQSARSPVGAIGIMQIMPATGQELKVGDIAVLENNVHAGVKYMRFMVDQYFAREPMTPLNKGLFAFAAYNAGPGRVAQLRREAGKRGLDPNKWFHNVELVAADKIGPETVTYVSNIYKYYTAYKLLEAQEDERLRARESLKPK